MAPRNPEQPGPVQALAAVACTASVAARTVACASPRRTGSRAAAHDILYGGQHLYVDVITDPPTVAADTFAFLVTLRNLIPQPIGTSDGSTADSQGVKVFFHTGPTTTQGSGEVTVANADGTGVFTAGAQPFFRYVGLVRTDSLSGAKTWKLHLTPGVIEFAFTLYVSSPVQYPDGWIDVTPATAGFMAGYEDTLRAVVRNAVGVVLPNQPVAWASSHPDSAPVTPLPGDTLAVVHGAGGAVATLTAISGPRSGTAVVNVLPRQPSLVSVSGRQLIVRGRNRDGTLGPPAPYMIRGVGWSPATPETNTSTGDINNANVRRQEFGGAAAAMDIDLMAAMRVNTVRLFIDPGFDAVLGPIGVRVLDRLYARGIRVVMTVDDAINDTARVRAAVQYYRNHPAILMWMLGNEWNINRYYKTAPSVSVAAQRTESAAALIKSLDTSHPVSSSYGDIDTPGVPLSDTQAYVNTACPSVDVWGLNIYRARTFERLFQQWAAISSKPMFLSEFGTDAFNQPDGTVDEAMQADWNLNLWSDLYRNLSALDPSKVALGGMVFEWNDEWWKVLPSETQDRGGYATGGHPDAFANEEYFGIVTIGRTPRLIYSGLQAAFAPGHVPPAPTVAVRAISQGAKTVEPFGSFAEVRKDGVPIFWKQGDRGGRGFNVVVVDPRTGAVNDSVTFDTYGSRSTGTAMRAMVAYLQAVPDGSLVMIAVADEAGLNPDNACTFFPSNTHPWVEEGLDQLERMGATQIRGYCFRGSWAMAVVKGNPATASDQVSETAEVSAALTATLY